MKGLSRMEYYLSSSGKVWILSFSRPLFVDAAVPVAAAASVADEDGVVDAVETDAVVDAVVDADADADASENEFGAVETVVQLT